LSLCCRVVCLAKWMPTSAHSDAATTHASRRRAALRSWRNAAATPGKCYPLFYFTETNQPCLWCRVIFICFASLSCSHNNAIWWMTKFYHVCPDPSSVVFCIKLRNVVDLMHTKRELICGNTVSTVRLLDQESREGSDAFLSPRFWLARSLNTFCILGITGFWTLSVVRYSKEHNVSETVTVFETLFFLVFFRIPDDGQSPKPTNPECHTPSSELFRIYLLYN
jgi:hypothetical protein